MANVASDMELDTVLVRVMRGPSSLLAAFALPALPLGALAAYKHAWFFVAGTAAIAALMLYAAWMARPRNHPAWRALHGGPERLTAVELSPWAVPAGRIDPARAASFAASVDWNVRFVVEGQPPRPSMFRLRRGDEAVFVDVLMRRDPRLDITVTAMNGQRFLAIKEFPSRTPAQPAGESGR